MNLFLNLLCFIYARKCNEDMDIPMPNLLCFLALFGFNILIGEQVCRFLSISFLFHNKSKALKIIISYLKLAF